MTTNVKDQQSLQDELKDQATHECDISMMPVNLCDTKNTALTFICSQLQTRHSYLTRKWRSCKP
jgi:hypothetical protein